MIKTSMIAPCSLSGEIPEPRKSTPRMPRKIDRRKLKKERASFSLPQLKI